MRLSRSRPLHPPKFARSGRNSMVTQEPPEEIVYVSYQAKDVSEIQFQTPFGHEQKAQESKGDDRKKFMSSCLKN